MVVAHVRICTLCTSVACWQENPAKVSVHMHLGTIPNASVQMPCARKLALNWSARDHADAARIVREILRTISQFHANGVVMRDVKPENFLFTTEAKDAHLKAIDFGIAQYCTYVARSASCSIIILNIGWLPIMSNCAWKSICCKLTMCLSGAWPAKLCWCLGRGVWPTRSRACVQRG